MQSGRIISCGCGPLVGYLLIFATYAACFLNQLEQTVRKLQSVLEVSPEQVEEIPSPISRMHELEQENELLNGEVVELQRQLELKNSQVQQDVRQDIPRPGDEHSGQELQPSTTGDAGDVHVVR